MYLLDTNVWLERLLNQEKSAQVEKLLAKVPSEKINMTDFCFHSISITLIRLKKSADLLKFIRDAFIDGSVGLIRLEPRNTDLIISAQDQFGLDYDDAYQYAAAEKFNLQLVSFDADFNKTAKGKKTPGEII